MIRNLVYLLMLLPAVSCRNGEQKASGGNPGFLPDSILNIVAADPAAVVISRQFPVNVLPFPGDIRDSSVVTGIIQPDPRLNVNAAARVAGRIEEIFVAAEYTYVRAGQRIFNFYSPELNESQEHYLQAVRNGDGKIARNMKAQMVLLGFPANMVDDLERKGSPLVSVPFHSPASGYLIFPAPATREVSPAGNETESGGMNMEGDRDTDPEKPGRVNQGILRKGEYFMKGQTLFTVNSLKTVWGVLYHPPEVPVKRGSPVMFYSDGGSAASGTIEVQEPLVREGRQFVSSRLVIPNSSGDFRINQQISATVAEPDTTGLGSWIPVSAVFDLGTRSIVWKLVQKDSSGKTFVYRATEIKAAEYASGFVNVADGLLPGDRVAPEAGMMTDTESLIRPRHENNR